MAAEVGIMQFDLKWCSFLQLKHLVTLLLVFCYYITIFEKNHRFPLYGADYYIVEKPSLSLQTNSFQFF